MNQEISDILVEIGAEVYRVQSVQAPLNSFHEAYAVMLEESDELWDEIKMRNKDLSKIRVEAIHTAATVVRLISELL